MGILTKELLYKAINDAKPSPCFRNIQDRIAFTVHAAFIASGFRLLATGPDAFDSCTLQSPSLEEVTIKDWNYHEDGFYGFIYFHPELGSKKVVVQIINMRGTLWVYGSRVGELGDDSMSTRLEINMDEYSPNKEEYLENFGKLVGYIEKGLVNKFKCRPSNTKYYHHSRHVGDCSGHVDILPSSYNSRHGKKLEDILPSSYHCDVPHVNRLVDYELIDISYDGFVSLLTDNGGTKDDLRLPNDDDNLINQIQDMLAEGKDLVVSVMMSATGEEQICGVKDVGGGNK